MVTIIGMNRKIKIIIAGIGGVGGYFGGLLAKKYQNSPDVEIIFIARGEHLKQIQTSGLKVIKGPETFIARPHLTTDDTDEAGVADYLIICTKSYDLESAVEQLKACINADTVILPLLNGVDATKRIKSLTPEATVSEGCVYIVSRLKTPGVIENTGNIQTLYFGIDGHTDQRLLLLEKILKAAEIEATLSDRISTIAWEKFIFISPTATATSYYNCCVGEVLEKNEQTLIDLIEEVAQIAAAKDITVDSAIRAKTLHKLKALPYDSTSSMHSDFKNLKNRTELESLTNFIMLEGAQLNIKTPTYNKLYHHLKDRMADNAR